MTGITDPKVLIEGLKGEGVEFIDLQFTDLPGKLQHITISMDYVAEEHFTEGVPKLDGSSIRGFVEIFESDMLLRPDPTTLSRDPYREHTTVRMISDVYRGYGGGRFSRDPRWIAQKAQMYLVEQGFDLSYWGPEIEFFVFDRVRWDVSTSFKGSYYEIISKEAAWGTEGYPIRFKEGYYPVPPQDTLMDFRSECSKVLGKYFGIKTDAHHHEVATAGQCEIDMRYDTLIRMADNVMTYKYVVRSEAVKRGMVATFMPKPIFMDNASGMHVHSSLWKDGKNAFFDANDKYAELSQIGRYYVGGLLEHSRALAGIVCPTTNSYRRLVPGYEAPVFIAWSKSNRSANVRIPVYQKGAASSKSKRVEFRTPDPSCNPYLTFAAMLMAGLDGIKRKIDPGDPVDDNIYLLSPERKRELGIKQLPTSLLEATQALESDCEFLRPVFTNDVIETWIELLRKQNLEVSMRPHPHEFYLYFDV
ncbi:MAG: type I glutamate--ammonia ligase [Aigarchaeota archaeon]|nr:type I glutamate--ammonia ligase [Aigarchaeota archaeon]MDW8092410.1 type I glutamate--ammonia ligase [Nitrososphaerota archaeon]